MRKFASHELRLREIEGRRGMEDAVLIFPDASTRGIQIARDFRLRLFSEACRRASSCGGYPGNSERPPSPPHKSVTGLDPFIDLFASATRIETKDRFLRLCWEMCKLALKREEEFDREQLGKEVICKGGELLH